MRILAALAAALCAGCVSPGSTVAVDGGLLTGGAGVRVDAAGAPAWSVWSACLREQRAARGGDACVCAAAYPRLGDLPQFDHCYTPERDYPQEDPALEVVVPSTTTGGRGGDPAGPPILEALKAALRSDEGFEPGAPGHVGYGHRLPLDRDAAEALLDVAARRALADAASTVECWSDLRERRRLVLANMAYQHGQVRLGGYKDMLAALCAGDYAAAAAEMLDSVWADSQAPARATRLARAMEEG